MDRKRIDETFKDILVLDPITNENNQNYLFEVWINSEKMGIVKGIRVNIKGTSFRGGGTPIPVDQTLKENIKKPIMDW